MPGRTPDTTFLHIRLTRHYCIRQGVNDWELPCSEFGRTLRELRTCEPRRASAVPRSTERMANTEIRTLPLHISGISGT